MTYQGLNHIVKSSVLASIKRDLRYGNRDSFNNLPDNLKLELVRSYRDFKFKKSVVKAHGLSASDDILSSTVTLVDYLGLSMHNVKAYSMLDFDDLDRAVKDEVESKFPHILGSIEKRISQIDSEITKEGSDLAEKAKTLFRKGWSLVEDRIKELDNNIVGYEKEISKLGEGNPHTKELLDQIESDQAKIKELEDSMDRRRSPGWPIEKDDKIGTLLDTVQELESEVLEIDLEMESLDQKVTSYTVAILKKREELYMGDWEFDQIFLDVLGISPDAELAQNTGTESGEEVKEEDKFTETEHLYEDDEIIQKKSALEDYGSGGMEKMILQRHELLEKINSLIKMREVKEVELNSFEKELQHLYLEREKVRRGLYKHFKLQYGDSRPAVLALELDVLEDRYEWAQKLFDSGRMVGVNSKALASGVFGSNYGSMAEDSKFIFSQLLEHSFFNLPFPKFDRQDVTLTHPDWEGEKLNLTMKSLRLFKDLQAMPDVLRVSYEIIRNKKGSEAVYVNLLTLFRNLFDKKTGDKTLLDLAEQDGLDELMEEFKGDFIYGEGEFSGQLETFNRVKDSFYSSTFKDLESRHPKDTMEGELVSFVAKHISNMMWHDFLRTLKEVNTDLSKVLNIDDSSITEEDGAQTYVGAIELNHPFFEKADLQVTLSQKLATILRNHQEEGLSIQDFKEEIFSLLEFKKVVQGYISRILSSVDLEDILEEYSGMEGIRYKDLFDPQKKKAVKEVFVMFLKALQNSSFNVSGTLDFEKYEGDVYRDKFPEDSFSKPKNIEQRRIKDPDKLLELELTMDDINSMDADQLRQILIQKGELPAGSKQDPFEHLEKGGVVTELYTREREALDFSEIHELPAGNVVDQYLSDFMDTSQPMTNSLSRFVNKKLKTLRNRLFSKDNRQKKKERAVGDDYIDVEKGIKENIESLGQTLTIDTQIADRDLEHDTRKVINIVDRVMDFNKHDTPTMNYLRESVVQLLDTGEGNLELMDIVNSSDSQFGSLRALLVDLYSNLRKNNPLRKNMALKHLMDKLKDSEYTVHSTEALKDWVRSTSSASDIGSAKESFKKTHLINTLFDDSTVSEIEELILTSIEEGVDDLHNKLSNLSKIQANSLALRKDFYKAVGPRTIINSLHKMKMDIIIGPSNMRKLVQKYLLNSTNFANLTPGKFLFEFFVAPYLIEAIKGSNPADIVKQELKKEFEEGTLLDTHLILAMEKSRKDTIESKLSKIPEEERESKRGEIEKEVDTFTDRNIKSIEDSLRKKIKDKFEGQFKRMYDPDKFVKSVRGVFSKTMFLKALIPLFAVLSSKQNWEIDESGNVFRTDPSEVTSLYLKEAGKKDLNSHNFSRNSIAYSGFVQLIKKDWKRYSEKFLVPALSSFVDDLGKKIDLESAFNLEALFNFEHGDPEPEDNKSMVSTVSSSKLKNIADLKHSDQDLYDMALSNLNKMELDSYRSEGPIQEAVVGYSNRDLDHSDLEELAIAVRLRGVGFSKSYDSLKAKLSEKYGEKRADKHFKEFEKLVENNTGEFEEDSSSVEEERISKVRVLLSKFEALPKVKGKSLGESIVLIKKSPALYAQHKARITQFEEVSDELESETWFEEYMHDQNSGLVNRVIDSGILEEMGNSGFMSDKDTSIKESSKRTFSRIKDEKWFKPLLNRERRSLVEREVLSNLTSPTPNTNKRYKDFLKKYEDVEWFEEYLPKAVDTVRSRISTIASLWSNKDQVGTRFWSSIRKLEVKEWFPDTMKAFKGQIRTVSNLTQDGKKDYTKYLDLLN